MASTGETAKQTNVRVDTAKIGRVFLGSDRTTLVRQQSAFGVEVAEQEVEQGQRECPERHAGGCSMIMRGSEPDDSGNPYRVDISCMGLAETCEQRVRDVAETVGQRILDAQDRALAAFSIDTVTD